MFGLAFSDAAFSGHILQGWRAVVEADVRMDNGASQFGGQTITAAQFATTLSATHKAPTGFYGVALTEVALAAQLACRTIVVSNGSFALRLSSSDGLKAQGFATAYGSFSAQLGAEFDFAGLTITTADATAALQSVVDGKAGAVAMTYAIEAPLEAESQMTGAPIEPVTIVEAEEPALQPMAASFAATRVEDELRGVFMHTFEKHLRQSERQANSLGNPHLGNRELVDQSLAADGLQIYQGAGVSNGAGNYLLRSWRSHNPKRGLHLLKTYLQMLWPNVWTCTQLWHEKGKPYPTALSETDGGNHYLTSRVDVSLPSRVTKGADLASVQSGLRAAIPARMVLSLTIKADDIYTERAVGCVVERGFVTQVYEGNIK